MDVREKILACAGDLLYKYGLRSVSIDEICVELRISKKTFYVHFKQKEELIWELLVAMRKHSIQQFDTLKAKMDNPIDSLVASTTWLKKRDEEKHLNFFFDLMKYYPKIYQKHVAQTDQDAFNYCMFLIENGIQKQLFRDDFNRELMAEYMSTQMRLVFEKIREGKKLPLLQHADFLVDMFIRGVASPEGLKYYLELKHKI